MFGCFSNYENKKHIAYTLAEVLIVMSIIMLIILALPPVTKKVFKIKDTRKAHGRYECYWKVNASGVKELYSYTSEENGREVETNLGATAKYCEFRPTTNSIYFLMYAVGGGGAGAIIHTREIDNGDGTVTVTDVSDLEAKQEKIQTTSNLAASNPGAWPTWVTWIYNNYASTDWPWYSSATTTKMKNLFDTGTIDTKQLIRYRTSGTAGSVVSTFLPQLPRNITLRLYPGKGGELSKANNGSGGDGEDTKIMYIYEDKEIEGLLARGGTGGNGTIDSKVTYSLVGGPSTDFDLSVMPSIQSKKSDFGGVIENVEQFEQMQTKVPENAGDSGSGETQFVVDTNGQVLYEYNDYTSIVKVDRRANTDWKPVTDKMKSIYYKRPNFATTPNCTETTLTEIEVEREGYCDFDMENSTSSSVIYKCAIGKVPLANLMDLSKSASPSLYADWKLFKVTYDAGTGVYTVNDNYNYYSYSHPFYNCQFNKVFTCKTKMFNLKAHNCTYTKKGTCANGQEAKSRNQDSLTYGTGSNDVKMKCPAEDGGDGAVVILW